MVDQVAAFSAKGLQAMYVGDKHNSDVLEKTRSRLGQQLHTRTSAYQGYTNSDGQLLDACIRCKVPFGAGHPSLWFGIHVDPSKHLLN